LIENVENPTPVVPSDIIKYDAFQGEDSFEVDGNPNEDKGGDTDNGNTGSGKDDK